MSTSTSTALTTTTATAAGGSAYKAGSKNKAVFKRRKKKKPKEGADSKSVGFTAAQLRVQRDLGDLDLPSNVKLIRQPTDWYNFSLTIKPTMGHWVNGSFTFVFTVPAKYPFDGPKVRCREKIYHPNIDLEGKVCVNVLRPWKPTYSVQIILFGLLFLFTHPNPNDPLNKAAAADMRKDETAFGRNVSKSLRGGYVNGVQFTRNAGFS